MYILFYFYDETELTDTAVSIKTRHYQSQNTAAYSALLQRCAANKTCTGCIVINQEPIDVQKHFVQIERERGRRTLWQGSFVCDDEVQKAAVWWRVVESRDQLSAQPGTPSHTGNRNLAPNATTHLQHVTQ